MDQPGSTHNLNDVFDRRHPIGEIPHCLHKSLRKHCFVLEYRYEPGTRRLPKLSLKFRRGLRYSRVLCKQWSERHVDIKPWY